MALAPYPLAQAPEVEASLRAFELKWARLRLPYEESAIVTPAGQIIRRVKGGPAQSWPGVRGALALNGKIFTHLHPPSSATGGLSGMDIFFGVLTKALLVRAVVVVVPALLGSTVAARYATDTSSGIVYVSRAWGPWPSMVAAWKLRKGWGKPSRPRVPAGTPLREAVEFYTAQDAADAAQYGISYDMVEIGLVEPATPALVPMVTSATPAAGGGAGSAGGGGGGGILIMAAALGALLLLKKRR